MAIKYLINIVSSRRDIYGNCYHATIITRVADGAVLQGTIDAPSNVRFYMRELGAIQWGANETHETEQTLPIRQFNRLTKSYSRIGRETLKAFIESPIKEA